VLVQQEEEEKEEGKRDNQQLDVSWMVEHATQVHKMLPGSNNLA
jgi:Odorant response abnormal 4-like